MPSASAQRVHACIAAALINDNLVFSSSLFEPVPENGARSTETMRFWNLNFVGPNQKNLPVLLVGDEALMGAILVLRGKALAEIFRAATDLVHGTVPFARAVRYGDSSDDLWIRTDFPVDAEKERPIDAVAVKHAWSSVFTAGMLLLTKFPDQFEGIVPPHVPWPHLSEMAGTQLVANAR